MSDKVNLILDASKIDMLQLCEMRYNYRYRKNKVQTGGKSAQLDRGSIVHAGMETYYSLLKDKSTKPEVARMVMKEKIRAVGAETNLEAVDIARIVDVCVDNTEYWEYQDIGFVIKAVEQAFLYLLYEDDDMRIYISGKIDLLVDMYTAKTQYLNLPVDHKSFDRTFPMRKLSNQFINYCIATRSNFLLVNKIGFQKTLPDEQRFVRNMASYDPLIMEEWVNNTVRICKRYIECIATDEWIMNLTSCDKFNRQCEYLDICESSGKEAKEYKLNFMYDDAEIWDVTKDLGISLAVNNPDTSKQKDPETKDTGEQKEKDQKDE